MRIGYSTALIAAYKEEDPYFRSTLPRILPTDMISTLDYGDLELITV